MTIIDELHLDAEKAPVLPNTELYGQVLEFLYNEAELLDRYRFDDWIDLFTDDVTYRMPVRTTQFLDDGEGFHDFDFLVDDFGSLQTRVRRLQTDFAWAETPPSRPRHYVSNVRLSRRDGGDLAVRLNYLITRTREDLGYQMFTGSRHDVLVPVGNSFKIRRRIILIDQTVITATNLSILF